MSNRHDDHAILYQSVDDAKREFLHRAFAMNAVYRRESHWILGYREQGRVHGVGEPNGCLRASFRILVERLVKIAASAGKVINGKHRHPLLRHDAALRP